MSTAIATPDSVVSQASNSTQSETPVSDADVLRRVYAIRSTWSVTERLRRRREADARFSNLLDALLVDQHAA